MLRSFSWQGIVSGVSIVVGASVTALLLYGKKSWKKDTTMNHVIDMLGNLCPAPLDALIKAVETSPAGTRLRLILTVPRQLRISRSGVQVTVVWCCH